MPEALVVADHRIEPGDRLTFELSFSSLPTGNALPLPVQVLHGTITGPTLWVNAAIHGDEINGVEIIRQVLARIRPGDLAGSIIAVPIVNVLGFVGESRYLPDRRDLNRAFPGSRTGSLAARLANLFMDTIVARSTHGIDLHTGSDHRTNLPQVRANLSHQETYNFASAFGAPLLIDSHTRDGSLREAAARRGIPCLLYEAGEAQRFNNFAIEAGVNGILRVVQFLNMQRCDIPAAPPRLLVSETRWARARRAGMARIFVSLGDRVRTNDILGVINDALGREQARIRASCRGVVIGLLRNPIVHRGDAVVHIGVPSTVG
jgi:hypothetical protein